MPVITGISGGGSSGALVQFVDHIGATPVVRFDFQDFEPSMVATIDLSPPPLRYAKSSTMLVDGERVNASAYENRTIAIHCDFQSGDSDSAAAALSALARELDRPNNILKVQLGSFPTFFRTYRSPFTWQMVSSSQGTLYLEVPITIEAEPFGLGLKQVATSDGETLTVYCDPTIGGRFLDCNGILGDVETPLQIVYQDNISQSGTVALGVRRRGTPSLLSHWLQAESCLPGTDTAVSTSHDTRLSGTGNNSMKTTFATNATMVNRVGFQWPAGSSVDARGSYRVFARAVVSGVGAVSLTATYNGIATGKTTAVPNANLPYMIDLGVIDVPQGTDPVFNGYSNSQLAVAPGPVWVQASGVSSATLLVDYVFLMPADDCFTSITWSSGMPAFSYGVIDAVTDSVFQILNWADDPWSVTPSTHISTAPLPMLNPGDNRLYAVGPVFTGGGLSGTAGYDDITYQANLLAFYWPRYLSLATA